jgi:crotonobetaine/carnitine-CoA ligase
MLLEQRAAAEPDRPYLQDVDGEAVTYGEAHERALRWAGALRSLGIGPETPVSTMQPNSAGATCLWLGLAGIRAWETPVHPSYVGTMLEHAVNTVASETFLVHHSFLERVEASAERLSSVRNLVVLGAGGADLPKLPFERVTTAEEILDGARPPDHPDEPNPWDLAAIMYTSGTTGPSKGVMIPWAQLAAFSARTFPFEDLGPDDCLYLFTPSSHIGAKSWPYLAALIGGRLVIRPDFKIDRFLTDIRTYGCTTSAVVGAIARFLEQTPASPDDAAIPLRNLAMAPAVPDLDGFRNRFGVRVCTAYAMTEIPVAFTSEGWDVANWKASGKLKGGYPGLEVRVVDEHDYEVGPGEVGELIVRAAEPWTVTPGYYGMPEATAAAWRNGWFHTGDGFTYDEDGYYYFVDRLKDTIRRRGENISSFEVEGMVNQHPAVGETAAVAVPSDVTEDEILVYVVPKPGQSLDPAELITYLAPRMPRFMVPRYVAVVDDLPRTQGSMRVQKATLRHSGLPAGVWDREAAGVSLPR